MILTGKTKQDFENWYWNVWFEDKERNLFDNKQKAINDLPKTDKVFLNALIVEFFDYKKMPITIYTNWNMDEFGSQIKHYDFSYFKTRIEALEKSIEKCNEIFNDFLQQAE